MKLRTTILALLCIGFAGCDTSDDTASPDDSQRAVDTPVSSPSDGAVEARQIVISGELGMETIQALGEHVEGLAEIHSAQIKVEKPEEGPARVTMTVSGRDLPSDEELAAEVRGFEGIGDAEVMFEAADAIDAPVDHSGLAEVSDASKTPEEVKAEVIAKLRADGVEGDIHVDVIDEDGERRVEVRVEKHEDKTE